MFLLRLSIIQNKYEQIYHYLMFFFNISDQYLKLENLMTKLSKPCIVDIKMGRKTYDPEASPEKVALEIAKFPPVMQLGYQFSGMLVILQYFNILTDKSYLNGSYVQYSHL